MVILFDSDTNIGGPQTRFPDTRHSMFPPGNDRALAAETLVTCYWKPVYKYLRVQWKKSNEDAKDLTQGFFARALEKDFLDSYEPTKARFRTYLRSCLDNFVRSAHRSSQCQESTLSLDFQSAENEVSFDPPGAGQSMEEYFQEEWVRHLFHLAVEKLRQDYESRGREIHFTLFARYDLDEDSSQLTYEQLAREFGVPVTNITNWLAAGRRDFRNIVLEQVRAITANEREFRAEIRAVLGIE